MIESILPREIEEKHDMLKIDKDFVSYWYVKDYVGGIKMLSSLDYLLRNTDTLLCFNVKRKNAGEFLKKVNNKLAISNSEKSKNGVEQLDIDILNKLVEEARQLRYAVQVESEDVFEVSSVLGIVSESKDTLKKAANKIQNTSYSNGLSIYPLNFKQLDAYKEFLPAVPVSSYIHDTVCKIFTTSSLTSLFPFYTQNLVEAEGICIGKFRNKFCMINFMKKEANNNNMLVIGSSGAGKSFLVKNMVLQYLYNGVKQVVLDPEKEYVGIARALGERVISKGNFNIMEIEESFALTFESDYLERKIDNICKTLGVNSILNSVEKEKEIKEKLKEIYQERGITENISSLYKSENELKIYSEKKYIVKDKFPVISELENKLKDIKMGKAEKQELVKCIKHFECEKEETESYGLTVFDLENCDEKYMTAVMYKLQEYLSPNHVIYIDEMWKLMKSSWLIAEIANMFKTIRKRGASIVGITQDISDIASYNNGDFGKSIFNNAYTKVFFKMEYLDIENIQKIIFKTRDFYEKITSLKRGSALIEQGGMFLEMDIVAFPEEEKMITGGIL